MGDSGSVRTKGSNQLVAYATPADTVTPYRRTLFVRRVGIFGVNFTVGPIDNKAAVDLTVYLTQSAKWGRFEETILSAIRLVGASYYQRAASEIVRAQ